MIDEKTPHLPGGCMPLGSTTEAMSLSLLLCPTPVGMEMHSSFKKTMQEPSVDVLSKITYSFAGSRLSHSQRSPQTCLQFNTFVGHPLWRRVRRRPHKPQDIKELADAVQEEWRRIPQATFRRLTMSMRRRCLACLATKGGPAR